MYIKNINEFAVSLGVVPKGLLTFLGFFLCNSEFSPCWALPEYIRALIHSACLRFVVVVFFSDAMGYCLPIVSCEMTRTK